MSHTRGPWKVRKSYHGNEYKLVAFSCKRDEVYTTCELKPDDAKLIVAACNSFDLHFGPRALEAAEGDALGKALEVCRLLVVAISDTKMLEVVSAARILEAMDAAREVLAMLPEKGE